MSNQVKKQFIKRGKRSLCIAELLPNTVYAVEYMLTPEEADRRKCAQQQWGIIHTGATGQEIIYSWNVKEHNDFAKDNVKLGHDPYLFVHYWQSVKHEHEMIQLHMKTVSMQNRINYYEKRIAHLMEKLHRPLHRFVDRLYQFFS